MLPRNDAVAETINKRKLEIVTLANLSSLTVYVRVYLLFSLRWGYILSNNSMMSHLVHAMLICSPSYGTTSVQVINDNDAAPVGCAVSVVNENLSVYLQFQGAISAEAELEKIRKKTEEIRK